MGPRPSVKEQLARRSAGARFRIPTRRRRSAAPMRRSAIRVALVTLAQPAALAAQPETRLSLEPFVAKTSDGREVRAERGRLVVPEDWRRADARKIELAFVRLLSPAKEPAPPVLYLHGGPGGSATGTGRDPAYRALWS